MAAIGSRIQAAVNGSSSERTQPPPESIHYPGDSPTLISQKFTRLTDPQDAFHYKSVFVFKNTAENLLFSPIVQVEAYEGYNGKIAGITLFFHSTACERMKAIFENCQVFFPCKKDHPLGSGECRLSIYDPDLMKRAVEALKLQSYFKTTSFDHMNELASKL